MAGNFELLDQIPNARTMIVDVGTAGVAAGDLVLIGSVYGFIFETEAQADLDKSIRGMNEKYTLITQARKVKAAKNTGVTINQGALVYWDGTYVTSASTGNYLIGHALEAAASADTSAVFYFDGLIHDTV